MMYDQLKSGDGYTSSTLREPDGRLFCTSTYIFSPSNHEKMLFFLFFSLFLVLTDLFNFYIQLSMKFSHVMPLSSPWVLVHTYFLHQIMKICFFFFFFPPYF